MAKKKESADARAALDLRGSTKQVVIDHHTVHHKPQTASIHIVEKTSDGKVTGGQDIDGVTAEELGIKGDLATALTDAKLVSFVKSLAGGTAVALDEADAEESTEE